jgi:hypothetical protein
MGRLSCCAAAAAVVIVVVVVFVVDIIKKFNLHVIQTVRTGILDIRIVAGMNLGKVIRQELGNG